MQDTESPQIKRQDRILFPGASLSLILKLTQKLKKKKTLSWAIPLALLASLSCGIFSISRIQRLERKNKIMQQKMKTLSYSGPGKLLGNVAVPAKLANIPFGEESGIVIGVKTVDIRNVTAPYNPTIVKSASGCDLFFRYDVISSNIRYMPYCSRIGGVHLDDQFQQGKEEFTRIDLGTEYAEDPRILNVGDQLFLFYNQLDQENFKCRFMSVASIDPNSYKVNYSTALDPNLQWTEKNWNPFEYIGEDQKAHLLLEYRLSPHKLFEIPNPKVNQMINVTLPSKAAYTSMLWSGKWGEMRGGAPAQKIGDEYLGFFHSFFIDESTNLAWYVMGAYTFESEAPFQITGVSSQPILFKGIYETPITNTASMEKRVIFPSGYVIEKQGDKELIQLACGENDCSVKIVTIDKDKLIQGMERFEN